MLFNTNDPSWLVIAIHSEIKILLARDPGFVLDWTPNNKMTKRGYYENME